MIRIDAVWLAVEPLDMRAGTETALARVVKVFGEARAHHAYLFANRRANRIKVLVHDGIGIWLCARRLHQGSFTWTDVRGETRLAITSEQLHAPDDRAALASHWRRCDDPDAVGIIVWHHRVHESARANCGNGCAATAQARR